MRKVLALVCALLTLATAPAALAAEPARHSRARDARSVHAAQRDLRAAPAASTAVTPASASVAEVAEVVDGVGDLDATDERGDVTAAWVDLADAHVVRLGFRTVRFEALTAVTWDDEVSFASWYLDTDGDDQEDFEVLAFTVAGRPVAEVYGFADDRVQCLAAFRGSEASGYTVDLPASCVGDPEQVRFDLLLDYDPDPVELVLPLSIDFVPDEVFWSPAAARGTAERPHAQPAARRGTRLFLRDDLGAGPVDVRSDDGFATDVPVLCDWDGDGTRTLGLFRDGHWWVRDRVGAGPWTSFRYGLPGDVPLCGDWDGDGRDTPAAFRDGRWYLRRGLASGGYDAVTYGLPGDVPLAGDFDGDGRDTIAAVRGDRWYLRADGGGSAARFSYGEAGDVPLVGDWDGDGRDTPGVHRGRDWLVRNTLTNGSVDWAWTYGLEGDTPLVW